MDAPERALSGSPRRALCQGDGGRGYTPAAAMGPGGGSRQRVLGFGRHAICSARREGLARRRDPVKVCVRRPNCALRVMRVSMCFDICYARGYGKREVSGVVTAAYMVRTRLHAHDARRRGS